MNTESNSDDLTQQLDRLVDRELSDEEYRQLLAELEQDPQGWRRCAWAFLEAQAWRDDLGDDGSEPAAMGTESPTRADCAKPALTHGGSTAAPPWWIAAGVMLAFILGAGAGRWFDGWGREGREGAVGDFVESAPRVQSAQETPIPDWLTFVVSGGEEAPQQVEIPIVDLDESNASLISGGRTTAPRGIDRWLREFGSDVERQRFLAPVRMRGGDQVVVPIEQWKVTPASRRGFQ